MSIYQPSIMMVGIFYAKIRNKTENIIYTKTFFRKAVEYYRTR